jgi:DNA-binding response OmpR family regulator
MDHQKTMAADDARVVEDEVNIRELLCLHLRHEGYVCDDVGDGNAAGAHATERYDLLVLDRMLPGSTACRCRAVRNGERTPMCQSDAHRRRVRGE